MPAPHDRRTRPLDPKDRDRLDQRPRPLPVVLPGSFGNRFVVAMPGDFGRIMKIFGVVLFIFLSGGRFLTSEPLQFYFGIFAGFLAIMAILASISSSTTRLEFVTANEFTDEDEFKRQTKSMHIAEVAAGVIWVAWLVVSLGQFDWMLIGLGAATLVFALARKYKLSKMSQPPNVWDR